MSGGRLLRHRSDLPCPAREISFFYTASPGAMMTVDLPRRLLMASDVRLVTVFALLCCCSSPAHGLFGLPGRRYRSFLRGEEIHALVSPMTTPINMLPADYYSLPFCKSSPAPAAAPRHLGEMLLVPDAVQTSPYRFRINVNESLYLCTTRPLTSPEVDLLLSRKFQHYIVHMLLDGVPLSSLDLDYSFRRMRGFFFSLMRVYPVDAIHLLNHLKFKVLLRASDSGGAAVTNAATRYEIIDFEVVPCSVARTPEETAGMMKLNMYDTVDPPECRWGLDYFLEARRGERITFTYQVEFAVAGGGNVSWNSRWDPHYLKVEGHHFVLLKSLLSVLILVPAVFLVEFLMSALGKMRGAPRTSEERGLIQPDGEGNPPMWKLIAGDVFRPPISPNLLCAAVATGTGIIAVAALCIGLAALGFMYPAPRGAALPWILLFYALYGPVGGFVGVSLGGIIAGHYHGWRSMCFLIAAFFPGLTLCIAVFLNLVYQVKGGVIGGGAVTLVQLLALWVCVLLPLTCCGGFLAAKRKLQPPPAETKIAPRKIPSRRVRSWLLIFAVGVIPFQCILPEVFLVLRSIDSGLYHDSPAMLLAAVLLCAVACGLTSVLVTRKKIHAGDWKWWWESFLAAGSVGGYVFLYAVKHLVLDLKVFVAEVCASLAIYLGFAVLAAAAVTLAAGAVGFLASFCYVRRFYALSKLHD